MALNNINAATQTDFAALSPSNIAQMWEKAMHDGVIQKEWLSRFEGPASSGRSVIAVKDDLTAGGGDKINFTVGSALVGDGVRGSTAILGFEEKQKLHTFQMQVDWVRNATGTDKRFEGFTAAKRKYSYGVMLQEWMARKKEIDALLRLVKSGGHTATGIANNLFYAGGGVAEASLTKSNVLDTGVFYQARPKLATLGARPVNLSKEAGYEYPMFVLFATTDALTGLQNDSAWLNANLMARPREGGADAKNPLFSGAFSGKTFNGITPYEYMLPDHDNPESGAIGCPLQPRALLRTATTSFVDVTEINGGGSNGSGTSIKYFRDFPGYDYPFTSDAAAVVDGTTYYAKIKDVSGANAGKFEVVSYVGSTGNNGNKLTVTRGSAVDGVSTHTTGAHPADSIITPCNASGVEYSYVIVAGAMALLRGYGKIKERLTSDKQDYEFVNGVGIESIFGQTPAQRRDGKFPNFVLAKVALPNQ